jgi:hypothetical protein
MCVNFPGFAKAIPDIESNPIITDLFIEAPRSQNFLIKVEEIMGIQARYVHFIVLSMANGHDTDFFIFNC